MKAKLFKILKYSGLSLFLLVVIVFIIISTPAFQSWAASKAAQYLSDEMGTEITIQKLRFKWNGKLEVNQIFVKDKQQDTLFYIDKLDGRLTVFNNERHLVQLSDLSLDKAIVNFVQHQGDSLFNYEFFTDYFQSTDTTGPKVIWTIAFDELELNSSVFNYYIEGEEPPPDRSFDENNMSFYDITAQFRNFKIIDDSLDFQIEELVCKERSGLEVKHLSAAAKIHSKGMSFDNMELVTSHSTLQKNLSFQYTHWRDFSDFNNAVFMNATLDSSSVSFRDLWFFSNDLKQWSYLVGVDGQVSGTLSSLDGEDMVLSLMRKTKIEADFSFSGLPDFDNTFMDMSIRTMKTDHRDLESFLGKGSLPNNFPKLGLLVYNGSLTGFAKDFVSFGTLKTDLGKVDTDLNFKFKNGFKDAQYSGRFISKQFDLGRFYDMKDVGYISLDTKLKGTGLSTSNMNIDLDGNIEELVYNGYSYNFNNVKGQFGSNLFSGSAQVNDENIDLNFNGTVDFTEKEPVLNFESYIHHANLRVLQFDSSIEHLSGKVKINTIGLDIDNFVGSANLDSIQYKRFDEEALSIDYVRLTAQVSDKNRRINIRSDVINGEIQGQFLFKEMVNTAKGMLHDLMPLYFEESALSEVDQDFKFSVDILRPDVLIGVIYPDAFLGNGWLKGEFHSTTKALKIKLKNNKLGTSEAYVMGLNIDAHKEPGKPMLLEASANDLVLAGNEFTNNIRLNGKVFNNSIGFHLAAEQKDKLHGIDTKGELVFGINEIDLSIGKTKLFALNDHWNIDSTAFIHYANEVLTVKDLTLDNRNQVLRANGEIGKNKSHKLLVDATAFDLATINHFISTDDIQIGGKTNGTISLSNLYEQPFITSSIEVSNFTVNTDTIGDVELESKFINNNSSMAINGSISHGLLDGMKVTGSIDLYNKQNNYLLNLTMPDGDLAVVENFTKGIASEIKGQMLANLKLRGTYKKPVLTGALNILSAGIKVDYLKTYYTFSSTINIAPDAFYIKRFKISDANLNSGYVSGKISHQDFSGFNFDIGVNALKDFLVLNTKRADNELFYGTAFIDGSMQISGDLDRGLDLKIEATSKKGTDMYLPLDGGQTAKTSDYIVFTQKENKGKTSKRIKSGIDGINSLQIDATVTDHANMSIIFDEQLNDKITGKSEGTLSLTLDNVGDLGLKGGLTIIQGKYLFTALDVYNKDFTVKPGGTVKWTGDPYKAELDLVAVHSLEANTKNLVSNNDNASTSPDIKVNNLLYLKGDLYNPDISFGIEYPDINTLAGGATGLKSTLQQIKVNEEELKRQTFSLLLFDQFLTPLSSNESHNSFDATEGLGGSFSDLISSQLSSWLNKINPNWDIDVDYRNATSDQEREELIVKMGTKFLNDRLKVDATYNSTISTPNFNVEYALTKDGKVTVKAYSRSSLNVALNENTTTQGVGFLIKTEFNRLIEVFKKKEDKQQNSE